MMGPSLFVLAVMLLLLMSSLWIGFALLGTGIIALEWYRDMPIHRVLAQDVWGRISADELVTLPLFILMGDILFHTRLSESLFKGLAPWVSRLPGGLLHVNVFGCTLFAAVSGSSAATTATVGRMTLAELLKRGYDRDLAMGSLAGAGTIGLLIPPSIPMVVYGVLAETSILDLFIAGIVPGLAVAASYVGWIMFRALTDPAVAPADRERPTWGDRFRAIKDLVPVMFLILAVIGSMYSGIASVTEAAAIGVGGALVVALVQRSLTWPNMKRALLSTIRTCSMIGLILCGALFLAKAMTTLGIPMAVAQWVKSLGLSPAMLILTLLIVYLILGTALDGLSAMVMTLPVALPLIAAAGFDKVWFGVFLVVTIELSNVSPPVGFNLFIIQQMTGDSQARVAWASLPFCILLLAFVAVMTVWPEMILWLPKTMKN
ncbi:MAG: TRAP transporter large permease subunit [Burkholderiales bacterium]|nr:TRAP transporter large permease subunit [Burkholderiales bacterium]